MPSSLPFSPPSLSLEALGDYADAFVRLWDLTILDAQNWLRILFTTMALIKCSECNGQLSDKAAACPHCGAPKKRNTVDDDFFEKPSVQGALFLILAPLYIIGACMATVILAAAFVLGLVASVAFAKALEPKIGGWGWLVAFLSWFVVFFFTAGPIANRWRKFAFGGRRFCEDFRNPRAAIILFGLLTCVISLSIGLVMLKLEGLYSSVACGVSGVIILAGCVWGDEWAK